MKNIAIQALTFAFMIPTIGRALLIALLLDAQSEIITAPTRFFVVAYAMWLVFYSIRRIYIYIRLLFAIRNSNMVELENNED